MKLSFGSYLDTVQLLQHYQGTHEANRTFALKHKILQNNPEKMVLEWSRIHQFQITEALNSKKYMQHFKAVTQLFAFIFLGLGFITGLGLLSYSGDAPVNVIYYLFIAMVLPLIGMVLSLVSLAGGKSVGDFFAHFFPLYWFDKILKILSPKYLSSLRIQSTLPSSLQRWLFIERLQLFSWIFSIGLLVALLIMVVVKDIAFGWSTTLDITPEEFHLLLSVIGFAWQDWLPSAIPSIELVELSQYFRLGEQIDSNMVANANQLGAWWKFLAMTTLLYAIALRLLFWLMVRLGFRKALSKAFLRIDGVEKLLQQFNTPFVTTQSPKIEEHLPLVEESREQTALVESSDYAYIFGWNFTRDEILLVSDAQKIKSKYLYDVGGSHSFSQDEMRANEASGRVLLYVKSWEPPTMDFIDFLEILIDNSKVESINIYPLGTVKQNYRSDVADVAVWRRKIQAIDSTKVWIVDESE